MQNATLSSPILLIGAGQGHNAPEDINDYLGRLVDSHNRTHTVVRVEPSTRTLRRMDGTVVPGAARLYIARPGGEGDGDDGEPVGHWVEADCIAAPGLTIIHWNLRTDYRVLPSACEALYQATQQAEARRMQARRKAEMDRVAKEARCEALWKELTPGWAQGYLTAERHINESDSMTDYFGYRVAETVFLGFSRHARNVFSEMRKFAATFPPTAHLAGEQGVEHRENYSGGGGYYLGGNTGRYSGWIIYKNSLKFGLPRGSRAVMEFSHWHLNH